MHVLRWKELGGKMGHYHVGRTRLPSRVATAEHKHDFHEMFLVLEGSGIHRRDGTDIPLGGGNLVFVRPEDGHFFKTGSAEILDFVNVAVSARWLKNLAGVVELPADWQMAGEPRGHVMVEGETRSRLRTLMFRLMEPVREPDILVAAWSRAIHAIWRKAASPHDAPPWLETLCRDLQRPEWMGEPLSFWQKRSGRSPEHLARSCRRFYGVPLNELVNRARIARAQFLLQTTDEKVTSVAFETGYNNLAHFYRVFERLAGETPRVWRRQTSQRTVPEF